MNLDDLRAALDALDEPTHCEGTFPVDESLAITLPDGATKTVGDPAFVDWLIAYGEPAPFGKGGVTEIDREVRDAIRLTVRGQACVRGFDPEGILYEIESALSPREHLQANLSDVLVYRPGGHFLRHKDTPTSPDLIGTLVVGLPIEHTGGAFEIDDGEVHTVDWSGPVERGVVRWVAMYGDVDHSVCEVESGTRVTLVYALVRTGRDRDDPEWSRRFAAVDACARHLQLTDGPVMIACTRLAIGDESATELSVGALRGGDRELADALVAAGWRVRVRACLVARDCEDGSEALPAKLRPRGWQEVSFVRLVRPFTEADLAMRRDCVTFVPPWGDGGGYLEHEVTSLESHLDKPLPAERWLVRRTAAATFVCALEFAGDGFVGNGAYDAYLYRLAALEVTRAAAAPTLDDVFD
jgi:hypothetical protein